MTKRLTKDYYDDMQKFIRYHAKSNNIDLNTGGDDFQDIIDKLAEYETAEEEGQLFVLPCKVGTRVYEIYQFCGYGAWEIEEHKIKLEDLDKIGKTVFLTREEAEKSLKNIIKENIL